MNQQFENLHQKPFKLRNNRKLTRARLKQLARVQSIPIWEHIKGKGGAIVEINFKGYKYIQHG